MSKKSGILIGILVGLALGISWSIRCGDSSTANGETTVTAADVTYDNNDSGLEATTVQTAIDELASDIAALQAASPSYSESDIIGTWTCTVGDDPWTLTFSSGGTGTYDIEASTYVVTGSRVIVTFNLEGTENNLVLNIFNYNDTIYLDYFGYRCESS